MDIVITIIVPYYNADKYLDKCLQSIRSQTFINWNTIVVDDGSSNYYSKALVEKTKDSSIIYSRHRKNKGLAAARNSGIKLAETEYVVCVDADDKIEPDFLEKLVIPLIRNPEYDCAYSQLQLFGASTEVWGKPPTDTKGMTENVFLPGSGTVFKKELWELAGGYCEDKIFKIAEDDLDFWLSVVEKKDIKAKYIEEPLYFYRRHNDSLSVNSKKQSYLTREYIYNRHKELFDMYKTGKKFKFNGYLTSAFAYKVSGNFFKALRLYIYALFLCGSLKQFTETFLKAFLPLRIHEKFQKGSNEINR